MTIYGYGMRWSSPIKSIPPGGPSTINGIHYQLLWSLVILGEYHVTSCQSPDERIESLTLVLEPSNGGDQQTISGSDRIVTQLKARSGEGAWSLQDIIRKVLPDLYLAVDLSQPTTIYQFVTEGHRGKWAKVEDFFRTLSPLPSDANPINVLNDSLDLSFGRSGKKSKTKSPEFWEANTYTQRSLFQKIVDTIRSIKPKPETYEISDGSLSMSMNCTNDRGRCSNARYTHSPWMHCETWPTLFSVMGANTHGA